MIAYLERQLEVNLIAKHPEVAQQTWHDMTIWFRCDTVPRIIRGMSCLIIAEVLGSELQSPSDHLGPRSPNWPTLQNQRCIEELDIAWHCFILIWHELVRFGSSHCLYDLYQLPLCLEVDVVGRWYRALTQPWLSLRTGTPAQLVWRIMARGSTCLVPRSRRKWCLILINYIIQCI